MKNLYDHRPQTRKPDLYRQVSKPDLVRIARALGLAASMKETSRSLVNRCIEAAQQLRRDVELSQTWRPHR
jgi:hypothetical protein